MAEIEVSAVLPVYNDLAALRIAIPRSLETLEEIAPGRFELIVAEDGSTDGSADFVREYEERDPRVRLLHADERLGRGRALNRAFAAARGSIVCYYDVDLATDMQHLAELIGSIREGCDIATGSRLLPESNIIRSGGREIASRGYNMLVRLILRSRLHDHQCGFKAEEGLPDTGDPCAVAAGRGDNRSRERCSQDGIGNCASLVAASCGKKLALSSYLP